MQVVVEEEQGEEGEEEDTQTHTHTLTGFPGGAAPAVGTLAGAVDLRLMVATLVLAHAAGLPAPLVHALCTAGKGAGKESPQE